MGPLLWFLTWQCNSWNTLCKWFPSRCAVFKKLSVSWKLFLIYFTLEACSVRKKVEREQKFIQQGSCCARQSPIFNRFSVFFYFLGYLKYLEAYVYFNLVVVITLATLQLITYISFLHPQRHENKKELIWY